MHGASESRRPRLLRGALWIATSLVGWLLLLVLAAGSPLHGPLQPERRLRHAGSDFTVIAGAGAGIEGDRLLNIAAIGSGRMGVQSLKFEPPIDASAFRLLRYRWQAFPRTLELSFMFRRSDAPGDVQTITLPPAGRFPAYFDLSDVPAWDGSISEVGFAEYPTAQLVPDDVAIEPFALSEVELWTPSWRGSLGALATDWLAYRPWALLSISALGPDAPWPHKPSAVVVLAIGLAGSALLARACYGRRGRGTGAMLCLALAIAWVLLDLRWLREFEQRHALTQQIHGGRSWAERAALVPDRELAAAADRVRALHANVAAAPRVLVAADNPYSTLRLAYHLLPLNAASASGLSTARSGDRFGAATWLVAYDASAWTYDDSLGVLSGPGIALPAQSLFEDGPLRVYAVEGGAR
ncbi:MAG: hypothetical protein EOP90_08030 [Lysobacteraceae bacterium]|nr:MAG: hypothetical protein EOP90_08030 [Xanthomonadaceae bacterium]